MRRMMVLLCWLVLPWCLQVGNGQDIPCTVTQEAGGTRYSVPEFTAVGCHYYWTNSTKHVVANHEGEVGHLVLANNRTTLTTNQCFGQMHYKRDCISEGISSEATCTTNCSGNAQLQQHERETRGHILVVPVVAAMLLVGCVFCAVSHGRQHFFNTVKQKDPDVEVQHG